MAELRNLLVELFVEELPPKALQKLGDAFGEVLYRTLVTLDLVAEVTGGAQPGLTIEEEGCSPARSSARSN